MKTDGLELQPSRSLLAGLALLGGLVLGSCSDAETPSARDHPPEPVAPEGEIVRIGDIDPDTPARRITRLQPLASYLGAELAELGFSGGRVVIARDIEEMAVLLSSGEVDVYLDSAFPTLAVRERAGSELRLRRWAQGAAEYRTVFVSHADSGIDSLDELRGTSLALQEEYSTSGFLLPAGTLLEMGLPLRRVGGPGESEPGVVSYFFTYDEENTVELVATGQAAAGAISNQELELMDPASREALRDIGETASMPRQLVSMRADLAPEVAERISEVLLNLAAEDADPVALDDGPDAWTWKFDRITPETARNLEQLRELAERLGVL